MTATILPFPQRGRRRVPPFLRVVGGSAPRPLAEVVDDFMASPVGRALTAEMDRLVEAGVMLRDQDEEGRPVYRRRMDDAG